MFPHASPRRVPRELREACDNKMCFIHSTGFILQHALREIAHSSFVCAGLEVAFVIKG